MYHLLRRWRRSLRVLGLAIALAIAIALTQLWDSYPSSAQTAIPQQSTPLQDSLPAPRIHPLPPSLAEWQDDSQAGDYFSAIQPTQVGYLVWSQFPIRVYVEPTLASGAADGRSPVWVEAVTQAVQEWNAYLPLQQVESPESADIAIWRRVPPLMREGNGPPRARSAETRYELYVQNLQHSEPETEILAHRFTILLRPSQTADYLRAAARHELGHALGLWGHSPIQTDALYFSQVRTPPPISKRDVNTLKRVYEQPTRLGWAMN